MIIDRRPAWLRSSATASRTAGATSAAKIVIISGSSEPRMYVLMPSPIASSVSCSTHCSGGPLQEVAASGERP